jgi:hypothetical protein
MSSTPQQLGSEYIITKSQYDVMEVNLAKLFTRTFSIPIPVIFRVHILFHKIVYDKKNKKAYL